MRIVAAMQADLDVTPLGTRSRLADDILGRSVLGRTAERAAAVPGIEAAYVLCPGEQRERCAGLLEGSGAVVYAHDRLPSPLGPITRASRKWALDGWRGGVGQSTWFDEYISCPLLVRFLKDVPADAVMCFAPAAAAMDQAVAGAMIEARMKAGDDVRLIFAQGPPGVTGLLLDASLIRELAQKGLPIGWMFGYKPDAPTKDLTLEACCFEIPTSLRHAKGRLIADTDRATKRVADLLSHCGHAGADAQTVGHWLGTRESTGSEPMPREVEIELTTDDPFPDAVLRPRGSRLGRSGTLDPDIAQRIATEVARYDDALIVLGGFGDPLRHPQLRAILESFREAGVFGVALRTAGVDLTDEAIVALIECEVDIVSVTLDAWTEATYGRLQTPNASVPATLAAVTKRLERFAELREQASKSVPIVVPEMTKARSNVGELDAFFDGWIRACGAVQISGASHFAGQFAGDGVIRMAPAARSACRRIDVRCLVLADGRVTPCDQDYRGLQTVGSLADQSLESVWTGTAMEQLRKAHRAERYDALPLCADCQEWHRP